MVNCEQTLADGPRTRLGTSITVVVDSTLVRRVVRMVFAVVIVLALLNVLSLALTHGFDRPEAGRDLLDLNREGSFGTWVNGMLAVATAVVTLLCGVQDTRDGGRWRRHWQILAAAFLYVSIDELLAIHERVSAAVQVGLGTSGALYFAWVIPAVLCVAVLALYQVRFLAALDRNTRRRLLVAATVFLLGAVGLELVESYVFVPGQEQQSLLFDGLSAVEEVMELSAFTLTLWALLRHLLLDPGDITLGASRRVESEGSGA